MMQNLSSNFLLEGAILRQAPDRVLLMMGPFHEAASLPCSDHLLLHEFYGDQSLKMIPSWSEEVSLSDFLPFLKEQMELFPRYIQAEEFEGPVAEEFQSSFQSIQKRIAGQEIQKAVPTVYETCSQVPGPGDIAFWLWNLLKQNSSALYIYGFWNQHHGILGATPELLFQRGGQSVRTMALAGTYPKTAAVNTQDLLTDEKEMHEHEVVVQDIAQVLKLYGDIQVGSTQILELPHLYHLQTWMDVQLNQPMSDENLIQRLHPTPALGVYPRQQGYQWMQNLPTERSRKYFGAPLLFHTQDQSTCLVAIRNIQWHQDKTWIGSGCGVVRQSRFEKEWDELSLKRQSVKKLLGLL